MITQPSARTLRPTVLLALGYSLAGWLALEFAVDPGYASSAFPPAGIALSALLIFGLRLWPGVFAGSLLVQLMATAAVAPGQPMLAPLLLIPAGATVQALAGAWLANRLIGFPNALDTPRTIVRFLALVAPLSSLISCSIAIVVLRASGIVAAGDAFFNWWSWWLGDTLGIMVAAPLMFAFFGRPSAEWRSRRAGIAIPLLLALLLVAFGFRQMLAWEDARLHTQFSHDTEYLDSQVRRRLDAQLDMMLAIRGLTNVSETLTAADFHDFVTPWLRRYPGTQNFAWSPLISDARRAEFEAQVEAAGQSPFRIIDRDLDGRTYPAATAAQYLPIVYVEPLAPNRSVVGLNPLSLPASARAIHDTLRSGEPVATEPIRLVQERDAQQGVAIYLAVSGTARAAADAAPRPPAPAAGVISAVFRMDDALAGISRAAADAAIELCLVDLAAQPGPLRLSGEGGCETDAWLAEQLGRRIAIAFAGRAWEMRLRAGPAYLQKTRNWAAWGTVATGLLAVGLLGAFLLITTGNTRRIAALVERRTHELAAATASLREKQEALTEAMRIARMGSWETLHGASGLRCSSELEQLLGCSGRRLAGLGDLVAAFRADERPLLQAQLDKLMAAPGQVTLDCRTDESPARVLQVHLESEWRGGRLARMRGTVQDVTHAREAEAHIHYLARFDTLTGLPNRSAWLEQAGEALLAAERHEDRLAVLFLDLDNFKTINDSLGHPVGDRLLAEVARRLGGCMRSEDRLARLGGDEFVALLPRLARSDDAAVVATKILRALSASMQIGDHDLRPSVSIGIALFPDDGTTVDVLLKHADTAMYAAKAAGRNSFQFFIEEMNVRATERLTLENALRRAIDGNQLTLHYQPQIDTSSGRIVGCEALVRWQHPERGLVPPGQFIPVAEDSGLIIPLGEWVMREACRQQAQWAASGLGRLTLAVNISALQFQRADFAATVARILRETGADPASIELELTESALMDPGDALSARLQGLVELGLTLALDDFGTGYSCLAYLKRLPLSRLKIDRSFVADLPGDAEDAAVVTAALSLARDLGMEVVAEGVETAAQRAFLAARQCTLMQGYLFSRPLDAAEFAAWLRVQPQPG